MILLRLISWPYARKHLRRILLTVVGVMLGVGVFVGIHTANRTVLTAFRRTIDIVAGATQLQISAGDPGFEEDILERVQGVPEVRVAVPVIEATVQTDQGNLLILGVDMLGDRSLRTYDLEGDEGIEDPLVFLAQPDSLVVTRSFAQKAGLTINSRIPMRTMDGERVFTVRGIMKPGGLASAYGGNLAVMDIFAAQKVFGRGRRFDRIDVVLQESVTIEQGAATLRAALGPGFQIEPSRSRGERMEATSRVYALVSDITSLLALFIGMFLIYNTFSTAVTQRRSEIAVLRALGAKRAQIRTLFLAEGAVAGLAGTLAGVPLGIVMARGAAGYISGFLEKAYGVQQNTEGVLLDPWMLLLAAAMGVITSLVAAVIPARAAALVDPVKALQKGTYQQLGERENRTRRRWAIACAALSFAALTFIRYRLSFYAGYLLTVIAAVLLAPMLTLWLARALRPALAWMLPIEGSLAADSLIQGPRRTSGTVAALMLSVAMVISLGGLARSVYDSITEWVHVFLNPDLFVTTADSIAAQSFAFPASLGAGLRSIDGVAEVQPARMVRVLIKNTPILVVVLDLGAAARHATLPPVTEKSAGMIDAAAAGRGVIVSETFARLHGVRLLEILEIPAPGGTLRLPVVGIVRDFSDQQGSVFLTRDVFVRYWNDDRASLFHIYLTPGAREEDVRQRILHAFGGQQRLFVLTNGEVRSYVSRITDQWFGLTYLQIAVAVLVAVLGVVNVLTVSITDRRRELGVLRVVGGLRRQVRHTIWMEAISIGVIGLVLGLPLGGVLLFDSVEIARRDLLGVEIGYAYPFQIALVLVPVILGAALLAALASAESAVRESLTDALGDE